MTKCLRPAVTEIAGASLLAVVGCASGPVAAPDGVTLLPYNGDWVLEDSERAPVRVQFASEDGYGFTATTGQKIGARMATRAERFRLEVTDSIFRLSSDEPGFSFAVPIDGTPVEVLAEDGTIEQSMTLRWDEGTPVVRRELPGAGWVSERFELTGSDTLVLTREAAMRNFRGRMVEGMGELYLAYLREAGSEQ